MDSWFLHKKDQLLSLVEEKGSPMYVYDLDTVRRKCFELCEHFVSGGVVQRIFYAIKANPHPAVLGEVLSHGMGLECVSLGELHYLRVELGGECFSELALSDRLLFTPNFAGRGEYEAALALGVLTTIDALHPLQHWGASLARRRLVLRVDPLLRAGHHAHVRTAGAVSKFGVAGADVGEAARLAAACGARIVGLHAHVGSGIDDCGNWARAGAVLAEHVRNIGYGPDGAPLLPDLRFLDVGGGILIPDGREARGARLDLAEAARRLGELAPRRADGERLELWVEPGRYFVGEAGVLLARVTQLKWKGEDYMYVGVDTGFNSLLRPILYDAYHHVLNLSRWQEGDGTHPDAPRCPVLCDVVGMICESGDVLGKKRVLEDPQEGDVLLIATAGAYGHSMSSFYNHREPAQEFTLPISQEKK